MALVSRDIFQNQIEHHEGSSEITRTAKKGMWKPLLRCMSTHRNQHCKSSHLHYFPVSTKHKKSEPVRKMLYQEKRNESAHFKIMRSAAEQ